MGIKTEDFFNKIPPKELTMGVEWLDILDSFNPSKLETKYVNECARRNPYYTSYMSETPVMPVEERLVHTESIIRFERKELMDYAERIETEGLTMSLYNNARRVLIKLIGTMGAYEYNKREFARLSKKEREIQAQEYADWEMQWEKERRENMNFDYSVNEPASLHEKILRIRKGILTSKGKAMTQREFAKYLEYPINKYAEAEVNRWGVSSSEESPVEDELLEKLVFRCRANPYWLFDEDCDAWFGQYDQMNAVVKSGDEPCVFASPDVVLKWIEEKKPKRTYWIDGLIT